MSEVTFAQLTIVYQNTAFQDDGRSGTLTVADEDVLRVLQLLEDDSAAAEAGVTVLDDTAGLTVGQNVGIICDPPQASLGILAKDLDGLLAWPPARIAEPAAYYVITGHYGRLTQPVPEELAAYREVLQLIELLGEAAAFLDPTRRQLMFLKAGRVPVPILYDKVAVDDFPRSEAAELRSMFSEDTHRDQKLTILADSATAIVSPQPQAERFRFLLRNLETVLVQVQAGYRLFASEFSYEKIRSDIEEARLEYLNKIHKTFTEIQGQLLGLPVATVVVASQLKAASACGVELWTDIAVLGGSWVFVLLLLVAVVNQHLTLGAISDELRRQKRKMELDYSVIGSQFSDVFVALERRITWHRCGLKAVAVVGVVGAAFASLAFIKLIDVNPWTCITSSKVGIRPPPPVTAATDPAATTPAISAPLTPPAPAPAPAHQAVPRRDE